MELLYCVYLGMTPKTLKTVLCVFRYDPYVSTVLYVSRYDPCSIENCIVCI